jgi:hypothetical protein
MQTTYCEELDEWELAEWEKRRVLTDPIDIEREEAFRKMYTIRLRAETTEDLLPAWAIRSEFLRRYPGDLGMIKYGSHLMRSQDWIEADIARKQDGFTEENQPINLRHVA